jgi:hypothetical protein
VVLPPPSLTKNIPRALEKVHGEYQGDYTRLLDYVRTTIVCDTLVDCEEVLKLLMDDSAFEVCRIKDRISREGGYDPDTSGGNRDVLLNGWLDLGMGRKMIVEVQVHLRSLFVLKADLHVLYDGARVLGNMDPAITSHEGALSDKVLEKMEQGVLKVIDCPTSQLTDQQAHRLVKTLKAEPSPITTLILAYATRIVEGTVTLQPSFSGWTMDQVLVPSTGTIACNRVKHLDLTLVGLVGPIPSALRLCRALVDFRCANNFIDGALPEWLPELPSFRMFVAFGNLISGTIDVLGKCKMLQAVDLQDNCLEGEVSTSVLPALASLNRLRLGSAHSDEKKKNYPEAVLTHYDALEKCPHFLNSRLRVSEQNKKELCRLWAEETRIDAKRSRKKYRSSRPEALDLDCTVTWPAIATEDF